MKKQITRDDYIKANRKASREEEIQAHDTRFAIKGCMFPKRFITVKRLRQAIRVCLICF